MRKSDPTPQDIERAADRIFDDEGRWYVRTREGERGPFGSRRAAEAEAELFVDTVKYLEQNHPSLPTGVDQADITVVDMDKTPWR